MTDTEPREGSQAWYEQANAEIEQAGADDDVAEQAGIDAAYAYVAPDDVDQLLADSEKWISEANQGHARFSPLDADQERATAWRVAIRAKRAATEQAAAAAGVDAPGWQRRG